MEDELCMTRGPSGAFCTLPKGHTGDHIAESTYKGNIIDAFREGAPSGGSSGEVEVKGGCVVLLVIFCTAVLVVSAAAYHLA
jgi:hypothetical protein